MKYGRKERMKMKDEERKLLELLLVVIRAVFELRKIGFSDDVITKIAKLCSKEMIRISYEEKKKKE